MKVVYRKGWVKIQQMYENLEFDLHLKLLFMVTGAYYESGLFVYAIRLTIIWQRFFVHSDWFLSGLDFP